MGKGHFWLCAKWDKSSSKAAEHLPPAPKHHAPSMPLSYCAYKVLEDRCKSKCYGLLWQAQFMSLAIAAVVLRLQEMLSYFDVVWTPWTPSKMQMVIVKEA